MFRQATSICCQSLRNISQVNLMHLKHIILAILFLISTTYYYQITSPTTTLETYKVIKIIDGDTLQLDNSEKVRLLGINTPEKNQPFYQEAKKFLSQKTQNKTVQIESHGPDKYQRTLAYIFLETQGSTPTHTKLKSVRVNINAQILSNGLATLYYYDHDPHYQELKQAEEFARLNNLGLWKKSPNSYCIEIIEFKTDEPESLILQNTCDKILNITYKDDASHIYKATILPKETYSKNFSHIWNTDGDSIYIYDTKGLLTFYRYN